MARFWASARITSAKLSASSALAVSSSCMVGFEVDNVDAEYDRLNAYGVNFFGSEFVFIEISCVVIACLSFVPA